MTTATQTESIVNFQNLLLSVEKPRMYSLPKHIDSDITNLTSEYINGKYANKISKRDKNDLITWIGAKIQMERQGGKDKVETAMREIERQRRMVLELDAKIQVLNEKLMAVMPDNLRVYNRGNQEDDIGFSQIELLERNVGIVSEKVEAYIEERTRCMETLNVAEGGQKSLDWLLRQQWQDLSRQQESVKETEEKFHRELSLLKNQIDDFKKYQQHKEQRERNHHHQQHQQPKDSSNVPQQYQLCKENQRVVTIHIQHGAATHENNMKVAPQSNQNDPKTGERRIPSLTQRGSSKDSMQSLKRHDSKESLHRRENSKHSLKHQDSKDSLHRREHSVVHQDSKGSLSKTDKTAQSKTAQADVDRNNNSRQGSPQKSSQVHVNKVVFTKPVKVKDVHHHAPARGLSKLPPVMEKQNEAIKQAHAARQGTGPKAHGAVLQCLRCHRLYTLKDNHKMACHFHPRGKLKIERYDSEGRLERVEYVWECCKQRGDAAPCCHGEHV
ncbi:putative mediator of RNA polymerase II transcription subunit 26 [Lingula anatina]|uniref:Mediator of RNA polymerase II transcription subunit 26 n=1 Tax=Lingula anatina TaxID=7574 RepID=A0A2R2MSF5_LINAN|nr:putative mediator of RNA polymerase II transcription subunit 26 [Lingula anatina]|eukprot:XP_023932927.1 putative mediator of RNA polymerase II transcription subunit 26 [Lingula anatina]